MIKKVLGLIGCLAGLLFLSCEVGLGETVDVMAPSLEITSPEDGSIIMNNFTMSGSTSDDKLYVFISINVTSTATGAKVASYSGSVDTLHSSWSCSINSRHTAADGSYYFDIPDGEYTFSVTAMDKVGRSTTKSRVYKIDNTAPVVVLKRPDADDSYGKTIKVTGDIADSNTLSSLYFTAYKMNSQNKLEKITTVRQSNISGVGLDLIVGKKYENPTTEAETKLNAIYDLMYNTRAAGEDTAKIYCVVEVADSAKEYKPGSSIIKKAAGGTYTESGFTPTGNLSTSYYIYDVIYDSIYSESNSSSYKLTNSDLVSIMNGTYTDTDKAALVKTYLSENCMDTSGTELSADKVSAFNLNPANSPYFEVSGYKYENGFSSISNESKITVTVSPGRDQISLKEKTIRLVLKQCDSSGVLSAEDEVVLVESLENIEKIEDAAERAAAKKVRDQALSTGDTIKIVTSIGKRKAKNYYVVCVEGCDLDGNPIENSDGNIYGFLVESVSKPPVITITSSPEDLSVQNTYDFEFEGTLTYDEAHVYTKYVVTAKNEKDSSEAEHSIASGVMDVKDDGTWSLSLPATLFTNAGLSTDALYMCTVQFIAGYSEDFSDGSSVSVRVHVDTAKPTMSAISVSPYYSIDASTKVPTVNGTITISANVSDNYEFYETNYEIYYMDGTTKRTIQGTRLTDFAIELKNVNTVVANLPVYDLLIDFECVDKAGNKQYYSHTIKVDQNTDKPEISFSNLDESITEKSAVGENANLFGQTGSNKILGTVTDDDRINSIVFEYAPLNSSVWTEFYRKNFTSSENYVTFTLTDVILKQGLSNSTALAEGFWQVRYTVTDKDGGSDSVTKASDAICLAIDNGAPTLSITTASGELIGKDTDKEIQGTASDGNGVVKIYRYSTDNTRNASKTSEYGTVSSPHVIFENAAGISSKDWTDTISATDNGDEFAYIAEDIFGRTTKLLFSYQIDSVNPLIDVTSPTTAAAIYVGSPYIASFRGTAEDPKYVKIADGTPIKLDAYNALSSAEQAYYKHVDASDISEVLYKIKKDDGTVIASGSANGTVSWSANIELRDSSNNNNPYEDAASIEFYAEDGGSLPSSVVSYTVVVDTAAPVLEITGVTNSAGTALAEKDEVYYTNDGIIIKGTVTEKNLKSVTCSLNDATVVLGTYDESTGKTPFTYTVDSASAGRKTFGFTAEDKAGQMSETYNVVIVKDSTPPVISGVSIAGGYEKTTGVFYVKSGTYTLSGTTTDTYAVKETIVKVKNGSTEVTSETLTDSSWTVDLDFSNDTVWINDATATVEITAYDVAGNASAVQTVTVKFDTKKPALNTFLNWKGKDMLFLINTGKYKVGTFGKSTMMEIEGCYNETGSGIKAVYYQIIPTGSSSSTVLMDDSNYESKATGKFEASSTKDFTIKENESDTASTVSYSNVFKVNLSGFKESSATDSNKLRLVAVDNVGNVSAVEEKTLNVDTTAPKFNSVASVEKLTNTEADVTVSGSAYFVEDSGAGFIPGSENEDPTEGPVTATINGIAVTGTVGTVTNILEATTEYPDAGSKKVYYSVTINKSYLETLDSGNCIIKVTAKDAANDGDGNESYTNIATVVIDKDAPNLDIVNVTPKVGENVNGKVKVSGTASDGNALKSVTLYTGAKATDAGDVDEITYSSATYYKIEQDSTSTVYNWSATIDTTKYTDGSTVKLLAVAEDEAGNKTYKTEDLIINQSTDKPALNLTSLDASVTEYNADAKDTNLLGMGSNIIYGNVSDDDGIASINIKVDDGSVINKTESAGGATSASIALDLSNFASLTAGEHKLYITVTDIKNETSYATNSDSVNGTYFAYDNDSPSIEVVKCNDSSYSSNMWGKSEFDIYIAIADSSDSENGKNLSIECKGISKSSTGNSGSYTAQTLPAAEKAGTWTASATIGGDSISNVWKFTTSNGEGYYKRTYEVTDRYGRSASIEVSYRVDTTAPVFKAYASDDSEKHVKADVTKLIINGGSKYFVDADSDAGYSISAVDSASKPVNWFSQTQLTVTGEVEETNLKSVTLRHGGNESTQLNKNFAFSESFVNGQNTFTLTALDEAGNSVSLPSSGFYALYVDTNAPTVSVEAKKADGTTAFESGTVLGASGVIRLNITAADDPTASEMTSGISKVYIGTSASVDSSSAIATVTASELEAASNVYTFTVGSSLDDGSYTLYVRAEDVAGNLSTGEEAAAFVVDKTAPKVTITSPVTGKTVDKKITISGTVQDSNLDSSVLPVLWIKEKTSGSWAEASADSVSSKTYSSGDWSLKFDTEKYDDEKDYYIAVVFTDKAGNATAYSSSTHTIHVSQDNDRPVIIFSNVELESTMSSSNRKMIKNNQISGTVTDADGVISAVYIQVIAKGADLSDTDSAWGTSIFDASSSLWSYTFPENGDLDGEKDIYFKVVDAESTSFVSAVAANYLSSPKLQYKTVRFETSAQSTILYASVDMINPEIKRFAFTVTDAQTIAKEEIGTTEDYSYTLSSISDDDFEKLVTAAGTENADLSGWTDISVAPVFGGSNKTIYLLACGYDTTAIDKLELKAVGTEISAVKAKKDTSGKYIYGLYKLDFTTAAYTDKYQKIDVILSVYDSATRTISRSKNITVDNKAPTVEIKSPNVDGNYFYGTASNSIMGAADDDSSVQSIYLGFSQNNTDAPSSYTDILAPREGSSSSTLSASSWIINFDDRISSATDYSHMEFYNFFVEKTWYDGSEIPSNVTEAPLYIWAYAKDSLGNSGTPVSVRKINIYTQGDIPSIDEVSYPDAGGTVGGTVRITGSASIADTSVAIEEVLIQIDLSYETSFDENWEDELTALINAVEDTDLKATLNAAYTITEVTLGDGTKVRGIPASGTNSWNLSINKHKEFNLKDNDGKDKNRNMAIRVYAVNNASYKKAGKPVVVPFTLDPGSPVYGNKEPLKLVQYNNNDARTGGVKASRLYSENMWISGKWWLEGSIEDDSGIKQVTVSKNGGAAKDIDASYIEDTSVPADETYKNKTLKMPVGTDEDDKFGTEIYEITAYEGASDNKSTPITITLNYDNKAPVFDCTTLKEGKTNSIVQSDGTYEIKGTLKEDSSASANQSGFERIAFSITKTSGGKTYVIDPMISQGSTGGDNVYETGTEYSDIVKVVQDSTDGLYWRKEASCTTSGKEISLSGSSAPANVRAGGLCKVAGAIYRIASVSGSKVYVKKDLPTYAGGTTGSTVDVYFAIAQVIDNTVKEVGVTTTYDDSENNIDNDDDDKMVDYYLDSNSQWLCSINSKNIKDGSVKINFTAFDQAGNLKKTSYDGLVSNNRPRIAGISFATDRNGNDVIATDEYVNSYSGIFATNGLHKVSGVVVNGQRPNGDKVYKLAVPNNGSDYETLSGDSVMTIKGLTHIVPEIVGGNNGVGYTYAVKETTDADFADNSDSDYAALNSKHGGDESVRDTSTTTIELSASQLMSKIAADGVKDFRFTIWDSTDGTTPGTDSNSAEILLRMNVALYDGIEPTVKLTPFYWNASGDGNNSVYYKDETVDEETQSVIQGHIELEDDLPSTFTDGGTGVNDRDPKVSGIIYLEGQAKDNVMINELTLSFPWLAESANPSFSSGFVSFASRTGGVISKVSGISLDQQGVEVVELSDDYDDSEYNIVKFKLAIDTSKIKDVARMDVELKVQAKDRGAANGEASTVKASSQLKNDETGNSPVYKMDIVPYITKLYTSISETAGEEFARSANGKYVVRGHYRTYSSEYKMWTDDMTETVRLYGFNLKADTEAVKIGSTAVDLKAGDTDDKGHYYYTFDVGKATVSGDLSVTVNSIESLNNKNAEPEFKSLVNDTVTFAEYNCQANGITNNRLDDDVSLYVWDIHGFGTFYDTNVTCPMMKMDKSGNYYMSYGYGVPSMYVNKNGTTRRIDGSYNKFHNTNVLYDDNGNLYAVATNTDRIGDTSARFVFYTPYSDTRTNQMPEENNGVQGEYQNSNDSKRHLEQVYNGKTGVYDINRVKNPKLTSYTNGATTYIGMAYFDYNNDINPVKARFGTRNGKTISGGIKGSTNGGTGQSNDPTKTDSSYKNYHIIASDNTTFKGGQYAAVGIVPAAKAGTTNNVGVVAWYDASVRKVCYSWNDDLDSPDVGGAWQTNAKYLDGKYTGWHVDLAVDDDGGIHIAYYNSAKGDLKYVYLSKYNATPTDAVTVDSYLSVGTNITVNTRLEDGKYVPYIYYYNASANQTPNSIKVAWRNDMTTLRDGALSDKFTGAWECMTIPTENIPVDATVCGGVPTSGTYSKTVVLGYMSDQFYEKAYIKK